MSSTEDSSRPSYVVVPRKDYEGLFNKQYAQLTSLQKKVDPELEREAFFETTLKTHYPKVYQEMIKNDFLLTRPTAIQHVAADAAAEKNERIQVAMQRQLDQVASGRQRHVKLSNPLYLFTQRYLSQLVRDSSLSPPKRRLLYTHLQNYAKRLPLYINRPLQRAERGAQKDTDDNPPPILIDDDDDDEPKSPPGGRNERSKQLKDVVRRLRSQRTTPSALRRRVKEEVKSEEGPTLGWLSRLRQRQLDRRQLVKRLSRTTTKKEKR